MQRKKKKTAFFLITGLFAIALFVFFLTAPSTSRARVSLTDLQDQIADLQVQINALQGDRTPPVVTHDAPADPVPNGATVWVEITISDDVDLSYVIVHPNDTGVSYGLFEPIHFLKPHAAFTETLPITVKSGGTTEIQNIPSFRWSNNRQLWWRNAKEQDKLVVEFTVEKAGDYDVTLGITKAVDYGIVRIAVNSETKIDSLDLYNQSVIAVDVKLPTCRLQRGKNKLHVTILGANPSAVKSHMFGLDYILAVKRK